MQRPTTPAASWRSPILWALVAEGLFFLTVLAGSATLSQDPSLLGSGAVRLFLHRLDRTFQPFAGLHPWYRLGFAIFWHNARAFFLLVFAAAASAALAAIRRARTVAALALSFTLAGTAVFWLANAGAAAVVVAAVARSAGVAPFAVWLSLLPHGVFELFALSWAMVLPVRLAWTWLSTQSATDAAGALRDVLWPAVGGVLAVLALAAAVEATVSPRVLHALVPHADATLTRTATHL